MQTFVEKFKVIHSVCELNAGDAMVDLIQIEKLLEKNLLLFEIIRKIEKLL